MADTPMWDIESRLPPEVAERLGYYVYLYIDPRSNEIFYVGKGVGQRVLSHLSDASETRKVATIRELREAGLAPRLEILAHALPNEETAFRIEAAVIDLLGLDKLSNLVSGWNSIQFGRISLEELVFYYAAKPVDITDPALLIRINRLYRHGMSGEELYDATRGRWKLGKRRESARYAMAVFHGVVREVYKIDAWHPAGESIKGSPFHPDVDIPTGRWEFSGSVAPAALRSKYFGRSVTRYFPRGMQSPVVYVNC